MSRPWSEQLAERYRLRLPADLIAWFDNDLWRQEGGGEFHCPLPPEKLVDPPPGLIWAGFLPPDMLPLVSNAYGDLLCLRVGPGAEVAEIVAWRHGGGDWLPYGKTLAEALLYDAVIGGPYSHQEQFVDRTEIDPEQRYLFAQWALEWLAPPAGTTWPREFSDHRWPELMARAGYAVDCLSRDECLSRLHTPLRESRAVRLARELELPWSPDFVSWQFDSSRLPPAVGNELATRLGVPLASLTAQNWKAAAAEAQRVVARRSDLGWAWDTLAWQAERQGNIPTAIAAYQRGLQTSQFADQAIDFRTHWFEEPFAKFSAWRLAELRDHLSPQQRADFYLQIFHAGDGQLLRRRVGEYWQEAAEKAEQEGTYRAAYQAYWRAGWDVGLQQLADYQAVLTGLIRTATAAEDYALAEVAKVHLAAL